MNDPINPQHYKTESGIEAIDVIEGFGFNFHRGNAFKYLARAGRKDEELQELRKADWYLRREIARLEAARGKTMSLKQFSLVYLATPYSKYPFGRDQAFKDAAALAAVLLGEGVKVYSPIAHTHPLAENSHLDPLDHSIWLPFDEAMMEACDALVVAHMPGWMDSFGVNHEIKHFQSAGKPVFDMDPDSYVVARREDR